MTERQATFVHELAARAVGVTYEQLPPEGVHQIKRALLDHIGCALAGWRLGVDHELIHLVHSWGGAPEATIWGDGRRVPTHLAALAIGTMSSHLEYDSFDEIVSAALTTGEMLGRSGRTTIGALAAGFRAAAAVKELLASEIEAHRLHWPAQLSVYSTTTVACRMWDLSVEETAGALSLAGCLSPVAPFEAFTKGASAKDLYAGWGAMIGVMAAQFGRLGFTGPATLFEGERALGQAWRHRKLTDADLDAAFAAGESVLTRLHFKPYAACTAAHPALSALELLRSRHPDLDVDRIARIDVRTYAYAVTLSSESPADTPVSARVSIPYLCAALLLNGVVEAEQTEAPHLSDTRLRELASRVTVTLLPGADTNLRQRQRPAQVTVTLVDGTELSAAVDSPKWATASPASDAELETKFRRLVGDALSAERRESIVRTIWGLESVADISELIGQLVPEAGSTR